MYAQNAHTEFHRDCAISLGAISKQIFVTGHTNKQTNIAEKRPPSTRNKS